MDYNKTVEDLIFNSSVQRIVVRVPIIQDSFSEQAEQFRASLSLVESNGINFTLSPEQVIINITDDEGISIMNSVIFYADTVHHYQREVFELKAHTCVYLLGRYGSDSLCRVERKTRWRLNTMY